MSSTRLQIVKDVVKLRFQNLLKGEDDADAIHCFVKNEPHKLGKIEEGRLRLISGVSMIDGIVDKMLFGEFFDAALMAVGKTPVLMGWSPIMGDGAKMLLGQFPDGVVSVDKSAWDWTVPGWMVDAWMEFILEMYHGYPEWFLSLIRLRFRLLFEEAVFRIGNDVRKQEVKGIMKSGCFLTYLLNSLGQIILHYLVCDMMGIDPEDCMPWCAGDDTVQNASFDFNAYAEFVRILGFKPKIQPLARHIEFIGFLMDSERVVPAYWRKHLFLMKYLDEAHASESLDAYQLLYRNEPVMLGVVQEELRRRDPTRV